MGTFRTVNGARLFVDERGSGAPTVVFLPGAGLAGLDYLPLHERIGASAASVLYDRAGTGFSERVRLPRTSTQVTDELRELLADAGDGPLVLVGHSLGGLYARHYAMRFPETVAGLVLLDPAHEDYDASMPAELTELRSSSRIYDVLNVLVDVAFALPPTKAFLGLLPPVRGYQRLYRELFAAEMKDWPGEVGEVLVERHVSLDWLGVGLGESRKLEQLYDEIRAAGPAPDVPTIVIASTGSDGFRDAVSNGESAELLQAEVEAKLRLYGKVAAESSQGEVRTVDAGHVTLPFRQPDAICQAVSDVSS